MNIAADTLLVLLTPLTILAIVTLRESKRAQGPDVIGPAFVFIVVCVARWIGALIAISLLVAGGVFDAAIPNRVALLLLLIAEFALVDLAAGVADIACAPENVAAKPLLVVVGRMLSFALPSAMLLWLMPIMHGYLSRAAIWGALIPILVVAAATLPTFYSICKKNEAMKWATIHAYWEKQRKLTEKGTAELKALPVDCTLEQLTPYLSGDWPTDVRAEVFSRIANRSNIPDEVLAMLADDQRRAAGVEFIRQTSTSQFEGFNLKFRELYIDLARKWIDRGAKLTSEQTSQLASDGEGFVGLAYGQQSETVNFYAATELWRDAISAVPQTPAIVEARRNLDHWFELYPRPVMPASTEAGQ